MTLEESDLWFVFLQCKEADPYMTEPSVGILGFVADVCFSFSGALGREYPIAERILQPTLLVSFTE